MYVASPPLFLHLDVIPLQCIRLVLELALPWISMFLIHIRYLYPLLLVLIIILNN
jgi:hypothetical protein